MNEKLLILYIAKKEVQKQLEKAIRVVKDKSDTLKIMDINQTTHHKRAKARMNLAYACEERDRWENRLDIITEWEKEINNVTQAKEE